MKPWQWAVWGAALIGLGSGLMPWQKALLSELYPQMPAEGPPVSGSLLGGLRRVAANFTWISAYTAWERRDMVKTDLQVRAAITLAPETTFFWINGARKMAYDFPRWQALGYRQQRGRSPTQSEMVVIREPFVARALDFLRQAERTHGPTPQLAIERAMILLHVAKDRPAAALAFRDAAQIPGAPYFAGRLYAELLREDGRHAEALAWYEILYPQLPDNDEAAAKQVVAQRIAELKATLGRP